MTKTKLSPRLTTTKTKFLPPLTKTKTQKCQLQAKPKMLTRAQEQKPLKQPKQRLNPNRSKTKLPPRRHSLKKCKSWAVQSMPTQRNRKLVQRSTKSKIARGTPVLFLVQDDPQQQQRKRNQQALPTRFSSEQSPTAALRPLGGVDFFYNLGRRIVQPQSRSQRQTERLLSQNVEVPLANRLPIIDFISTNEFQNMCTPRKHRARRLLI